MAAILVEKTAIAEVLILTPRRFVDERGFFSESWNRNALAQAGLQLPDFVQDNHSMSTQVGTLRGLHYQADPHAQGKLVRCGRGRLFDVAVDIRLGSPSYGKWVGVELSFDNARQLWIPPGFLHGFITRDPDTEIQYKCTDYYAQACDGAVRWDSVGIDWGLCGAPILSAKDADATPLADFNSPFLFEPAA